VSRALLVLLAVAVACARPGVPAPPATVRTVAVLPVANRTGDDLLITGRSLLEKYVLRTERVTVPDALAVVLRDGLVRRGYDVVPANAVDAATDERAPKDASAAAEVARHGRLPGLALFVAVNRWQGDGGTHPSFVIVGLDAALIDPATGHVVWTVHRAPEPVPTPGAVTLGSAYEIAVDGVVAELLAPWPARSR
jgi:hypothetical protein